MGGQSIYRFFGQGSYQVYTDVNKGNIAENNCFMLSLFLLKINYLFLLCKEKKLSVLDTYMLSIEICFYYKTKEKKLNILPSPRKRVFILTKTSVADRDPNPVFLGLLDPVKTRSGFAVLQIRADFFRIRIRGSGFKISDPDPYGNPFFILKKTTFL